MWQILLDPDRIQGAINLVLQVEAAVLGLVGIVRGSDAVKKYQESRARDALHSALESAVGLATALESSRNIAGRALGEVAEVLSQPEVARGIAYVEESVPDAIKKLVGPIGARETKNQIERMLIAKATKMLGSK